MNIWMIEKSCSVLTRPRPCGIPARKTEMAHLNQENAPVRAQRQATSQTDLSSFNGQLNTKAFYIVNTSSAMLDQVGTSCNRQFGVRAQVLRTACFL